MSPATSATSAAWATSAACEELFALRRGVATGLLPDGGRHLVAWPHAETVGRLTAGQQAVLRAVAGRAYGRVELAALCAGHDGDGDGGAGRTAELLDRLRAGGWLKTTVCSRGRALYTLDPLRPPPSPRPRPRPRPEQEEQEEQEAQAALVLSRFAVLRRDGGGLVLESPLAWCDVHIHDPDVLAGVLGRLTGIQVGSPAVDSPAQEAGASPTGEVSRWLVDDLHWAGMAVPAESEESEFRLRQWGPHELWFHDRSRLGYRGLPGDGFAATFWAKGRFDPVPARPEPYPGPAVDLHRPDLDALRRTDPPLAAVVEDRRSVRDQDDADPVTAGQLGEFLHRCARIRWEGSHEGVDVRRRPCPSGGGVSEVEVYPVVRHAAGLAPGMYHYDPYAHQLRLVQPVSHPAVRRLLRAAGATAGRGRPPQVLVVLSARVGRLMWKYEGIPYATVLKNVGALYQTMYLTATAMGLAPCALGSGDAVAFTQATGRDPLEECSVGEFTLGSRLATDPQADPPAVLADGPATGEVR